MIEVNLETQGGTEFERTMTLSLEGDLGQDAFADVSEMLFRYAQRGIHHIVVDFQAVTHLDHRVVTPLLRRAKAFRAAGGSVTFSKVPPYVMSVLQASGLQEELAQFGAMATPLVPPSQGAQAALA